MEQKLTVVENATPPGPTLEPSYLELIRDEQAQNKERAGNLPILNDEARKSIVEATIYSGYYPNPITVEFIKQYILSAVEFPTPDGCLAQSVTELNTRVDNLFGDAYSFDKAKLEMRSALVNVKRAQKQLAEANDEIDKEDAQINIEKAMLEAAAKKASLKKIELTAMARYKEAMAWKTCAEFFMEKAGYKSLDEVKWDDIRMKDMAGKIQIWGQLAARGKYEETPSKLAAVIANPEAFHTGIQMEQARMEFEKKALAEQRRQLDNAGVNIKT